MCSILFTNKEITDPKVNELLQKRGPDGTHTQSFGEYNFIHNLLSLTGDTTKQPVEQEGIIVTFNGEIYNYLDIDPLAKSDIYSIITAYKKYGDKFIQYLDGEFALVLLDTNKQKIIFSSDIFKTKPLFYAFDEKYIGVSTFETPLRHLGFPQVNRVIPNHSYVIDLEKQDIKTNIIKEFDLNQHKDNFNDWIKAFEKSIEKRASQSGDKKLFIGLSSGYDSGAIACALNKLKVDNKCYSIYASENPDIINQRKEILNNVQTINLTKSEYDEWNNYVQQNCESFISNQYSGYDIKNDKASVGLAFICNLAKKENRKIYLSGQGADEIISDYGIFGKKLFGDQQSTFGGIFPDNLENHFPWKNFFDGTMEMYIAKEEYVAGAFGIETRYPFLDPQVVQEFLWLLPELKNKYYKSVIHEYLTKNDFPFELNNKIGFQANRNLTTL